jgi:hypothetical protein
MQSIKAIGVSACSLALLTCAAVAAQNDKVKNAPPARPAVVQRPMVRQQGIVNQQQHQNIGQPKLHQGVNNQGGQKVGGVGSSGVQQTPRSELMQMVKPVGVAPVKMPSHALSAHVAPLSAQGKPGIARSSLARPANLKHDSAHKIGKAGARYDHRPVAFSREGALYHRNYYPYGGAWYWYDAPFVETDPDYSLVDDGTLPSCNPDADECQ